MYIKESRPLFQKLIFKNNDEPIHVLFFMISIYSRWKLWSLYFFFFISYEIFEYVICYRCSMLFKYSLLQSFFSVFFSFFAEYFIHTFFGMVSSFGFLIVLLIVSEVLVTMWVQTSYKFLSNLYVFFSRQYLVSSHLLFVHIYILLFAFLFLCLFCEFFF